MTKKKSIKGLLIYFLIGIIALYFSILLGISKNPNQLEQLSEISGFSGPPEMLALLAIMPNFILFIIALVIGFFTAHKVGLKSVIMHPNAREKSKSEWIKGIKLAIILGSIAGVVIRGFDYLLLPFLPDSIIETLQPYSALHFILALLYGGIVEEILNPFWVYELVSFCFMETI